MNWLARVIIQSAEKEYSRATKSFFTTWGFILFELLVPAGFLLLGFFLERGLGIHRILSLEFQLDAGVRAALFIPVLVLGQVFIIWTAVHQLRYSGGTPAFKAPPKKLLVAGPYRLCRNPMVFGYLVYYYGLAFLLASPTALFVLFPAFNLLALYVIINVEEVELEERFGADYLAYKTTVNRLIPVPPRWRRFLGGRRRDEGAQPGAPLEDEG